MIIGSAAHLKICHCGHHGRVYTADGSPSCPLFSKESALDALDDAIDHGLTTIDEVPELKRQIMTSSLPRFDIDIMPRVKFLIKLCKAHEEMINLEAGSGDDIDYHEETVH